MSVHALDRAAGFAPAARLLAAWWSEPTAAELDRWDGSWAAAEEVADRLGVGGVELLRETASEADPALLREEHERLLVGPGRTPCPPYESMWRSGQARRDQGRLMAACAADVARLYSGLGLRVRAAAHELPDHLVVELEALAFALEHDATDIAATLAREHLAAWTPAFCDGVAAETTEPFYAALARVTPEWTAALSA